MNVRRVVTGLNAGGQSCVIDDNPTPRWYEIASQGGKSLAAAWETEVPVDLDFQLRDSDDHPLPMIARAGRSRFIHVVEPPASRRADEAVIAAELAQKIGDRDNYFEADGLPMHSLHRTPTVDVLFIVSGSIDLILEADRVTLNAGDLVVQQGTWHGWENTGDVDCVLVGVNFPLSPGAVESILAVNQSAVQEI